jgi:hypothetical protein
MIEKEEWFLRHIVVRSLGVYCFDGEWMHLFFLLRVCLTM